MAASRLASDIEEVAVSTERGRSVSRRGPRGRSDMASSPRDLAPNSGAQGKVHLEDQKPVVDHHVLQVVLLLQVQRHTTASLHLVHELWLLPWGQLPDQFP